jgi:hypothetical protein
MRKSLIVLAAVLGLAGLVAVASAHTVTGNNGSGYGWYGMGPAMMGPGWANGGGYYCNGYGGYGGTATAALLGKAEVQKRVETFAAKSFPGYKVGTVERDDYGRPFYTASLTGNHSRFEVQVNGFDGSVIGVYPDRE